MRRCCIFCSKRIEDSEDNNDQKTPPGGQLEQLKELLKSKGVGQKASSLLTLLHGLPPWCSRNKVTLPHYQVSWFTLSSREGRRGGRRDRRQRRGAPHLGDNQPTVLKIFDFPFLVGASTADQTFSLAGRMSPHRPSNFAHIPVKVGEQSAVHVREPVEADTPNRLKAEVLALPRGEAFWCKEASIVPNLFNKK